MKKRVRKKTESGALFDIESPLAIELRRIMIRLSKSFDLDRKRCLMITSSERGEGKSLFALHFALVLAYHMKKKILLIDGDIRRPVQHTIFHVPCSPGLVDYLVAESAQDDVKPVATKVPCLSFLPAGTTGDYPSRLFSGGRFRRVVQEFFSEFDIVILDAPPVIPVSDPLHYLEAVDGVLFIVMAGHTSKDIVLRGVDILRGVGANVLGVIANNLSEVLPYYYDKKYYGYNKRHQQKE